jgi:hypothetical protein
LDTHVASKIGKAASKWFPLHFQLFMCSSYSH